MSNAQQVQAAAAMCIVGCKLPHGLQLQLTKRAGKDGAERVRVGDVFTVKGMNAARIVGGYGLTDGIPKDFMDEWLKQNSALDCVKNGSIFMHTSVDGAIARAKEGRDAETGLEGIDPVARAKKAGLDMDPAAIAEYNKAKRENPMNGRQIAE